MSPEIAIDRLKESHLDYIIHILKNNHYFETIILTLHLIFNFCYTLKESIIPLCYTFFEPRKNFRQSTLLDLIFNS